MDFTLRSYTGLLTGLQKAGYAFLPFCEFVEAEEGSKQEPGRVICLRHDVDARPGNSLKTAKLEAELGIRASYYFRAVPCSWDESIIREISALGHEIGYHYESLTICGGNTDAAYEDFRANLARLREIANVQTICMHGSPRSKYDSRDIWAKYDYRELGITGEPYLDTDWSRTFYLTDTGRRWDGFKVSVRDKIPQYQDEWSNRGLVFHGTEDIIGRIGELPDRIMITTHPQRWNDGAVKWFRELVLQNAKNFVKYIVAKNSI